MAVTVDGELPAGVTAKDVVLAIIARIGTGGGIGSVIEYRGAAIRALSMEGRMTVCNMSIEAGARAGLIAPDDTTFAYLEGRRPRAEGRGLGAGARRLALARHRRRRGVRQGSRARRRDAAPARVVGHEPGQTMTIDDAVPDPDSFADADAARVSEARARATWACKAGTPMRDIAVDTVFIGSCTNSRIEDLRAAADVARGRGEARRAHARGARARRRSRRRPKPKGSTACSRGRVRLARAGCSMCLAMNPDKLAPGERCASTSNRNFEGRQGKGGRTHLVSPAVAAATAIAGHFATPEDLRLMDAVRVDHRARRCRSTAPTSTPTRSSRATG